MSEAIKPDLVLPLTRAWFAKIWNGDKRTEYRAVKPYWTKRIGAWVDDNAPRFILFQIGYAKDSPCLLVQTAGVDIGPCPYPGWRGDFYRIRFEIVQPYMRIDGVFYPMAEMPRMNEKGGKARIVCRFTKKQVVEAFQNEPIGPDVNDPIFGAAHTRTAATGVETPLTADELKPCDIEIKLPVYQMEGGAK